MRLGREKYFLEKLVIRIVAFKRIKKKRRGGNRENLEEREMSLSMWIIRASTRGEDKDLAVKGSSRIACLGKSFLDSPGIWGSDLIFSPVHLRMIFFCNSYLRFEETIPIELSRKISNFHPKLPELTCPRSAQIWGRGWKVGKKFRNFRAVIPLETVEASLVRNLSDGQTCFT